MKRIRFAIAMILTLSMLFGTTSFAQSGSTNGITVIREMSSVDINGRMFLIVEVRNDNDVDCSVYVDARSTASDGTVIGRAYSDEVYIEANGYYALVVSFSDPASAQATNYNYDLIVDSDISPYNVTSAVDCLDAHFSPVSDNDIEIYATNISPYTIRAEAIVIFYDGDEIVDFTEVALSQDPDFYMFPGEVTTEIIHTDMVYDSCGMHITATK